MFVLLIGVTLLTSGTLILFRVAVLMFANLGGFPLLGCLGIFIALFLGISILLAGGITTAAGIDEVLR